MKFWQVTSIFRDEPIIVEDAFRRHHSYPYLQYLQKLNHSLKHQVREILDNEVPDNIVEEICRASNKVLFYSASRETIFNYRTTDTTEVVNIYEAFRKFDHDAIEEAFEKSEAYVG